METQTKPVNDDYSQEARSRVIGGSDAGVILGLSPFVKPMTLYMIKKGLLENPESLPMSVGKVLEPLIADEYLKRMSNGYSLIESPIKVHPHHPWMVGHVDRLVYDGDELKFGLECKSTNAFFANLWGEEGSDDIPDYYLTQVQHYMAVTGLERFDVAALIGNNDLRIYTVYRNDALIEAIIRAESDFYECLANDTPPEIDDTKASADFLAWKHPKDSGEVIEVTLEDPIYDHITDLRNTRDDIKTLESAKIGHENKIKEFMGDNRKITCELGSITWTKSKDGVKTDWKNAVMSLPNGQREKLVAENSKPKPGTRSFRPTFKKVGE